MGGLTRVMGMLFLRTIPNKLPRSFRYKIIRAMINAERSSQPKGSIRWLLQIHDDIAHAVDQKCVEWGNGVHIKHELMRGIHSFFYERIPQGAVVLDIGCGCGAVAWAIARHTGALVVGIDINKRHIDFARDRFSRPNLRFEVADATKYLPSERIDVAVLSSVLEHLPTRVEFLRRLIEIHHPITLLIRVPTLERHHFVPLKQELGLFAYTDPTHLIEYSPGLFEAEMEEAGLEIKHMEICWGDIWAECIPKNSASATLGIRNHKGPLGPEGAIGSQHRSGG